MRLKAIWLGLLLGQIINVSFVQGGEGKKEVIIHNKSLDLTRQKVMQEFLLQPIDLQERLKKNEMAFRKFVDAINNELLFEQKASELNLKADPIIAQRLEIAARKALISEMITQKAANIKVPDMAPLALAEYKAHPENYVIGESVNARHILVAFDSQNKAEKIALLEGIRKKVASGESFADLAKQFSEDKGSAAKGGELGLFKRGQMVKPFEHAAFSLKKPSQLSEVIETQFGLHLIQLIEHLPAKHQPFDTIKADLIASMKQDYINNEIKSWRDDIIDLKHSTLNQAELEKLVTEVKNLP